MLRNTGPSENYAFEVKQTFAPPNWVESASSVAIGDVDNDGDLDLFITAVYGGQYARLYENPGVNSTGPWNFVNVTGATGLPNIQVTYQAAFADCDNDGDLDLVTDNQIFSNNTSQTTFNNWLRIKLVGDGNNVNTTAIGAVVRADLGNGQILTRTVEGQLAGATKTSRRCTSGWEPFLTPSPWRSLGTTARSNPRCFHPTKPWNLLMGRSVLRPTKPASWILAKSDRSPI